MILRIIPIGMAADCMDTSVEYTTFVATKTGELRDPDMGANQ